MGTTSDTTASTGIKLPVAYTSTATYSAIGINDNFEGNYGQMFECKKKDTQYIQCRSRTTEGSFPATGNNAVRNFSLICIGY